MTLRRSLYILLVIAVAGFSALTGALAGGAVVYRALQDSLPGSVQEILPSDSTNPGQTLTLSTTDIETSITQSVEKVGPAVLTVVGTIPSQFKFFGPTGDQTVSGTGFFINDQGYIITNNHVVEGAQEVTIVLSDGTEQRATIVGTDIYSDIAVLKMTSPVLSPTAPSAPGSTPRTCGRSSPQAAFRRTRRSASSTGRTDTCSCRRTRRSSSTSGSSRPRRTP